MTGTSACADADETTIAEVVEAFVRLSITVFVNACAAQLSATFTGKVTRIGLCAIATEEFSGCRASASGTLGIGLYVAFIRFTVTVVVLIVAVGVSSTVL